MTQQVANNSDIEKERAQCTFNPIELTHLLDGSEQLTQERKERENYFLNDADLKHKVPLEYLSHKEKYEESIRRACIVFRKIQQLQNEGKAGMESYREVLGGQLGSAIMKDSSPFSLHYVMFIPTLMGQGTYEQQAKWIERAWNCDIIGTYAQTELGHGTFIRGLETTAIYDEKTEEFVLHSPTITSHKWWPGGLGQTANYAVVLAQLYTKGKCYGIHPFIVQLRDENTHIPLKGIKIGDIGSKLGMNCANNGFLGFDHVRIPREHLLMKNNQVLPDGTYIKSPSSKLTYGTMIFVRVVLVQDAAMYMRKAVVIATRYSVVRHQSELKPNEPEPQILSYITQQYKIFPQIATFFAFHYSAKWLWNLYNNVTTELEGGQLENLPELHALACCLKSVCTTDAARAVEICRLACGGHGYMISSNLPSTYGLVTAMCTYEGENTVLLLQTARFLIKSWQNRGQLDKLYTVSYLQKASHSHTPFQKSTQWILAVLQLIAIGKIEIANHHINQRVQTGMSFEDAWNETSIELVEAADLHCRYLIVHIYNESMEQFTNISPELRTVLRQLLELYAVSAALRLTGELQRFAKVTGPDIEAMQKWLEKLLHLIRPNAIGIVDGFDVHDDILSSTLGSYDGNVYERLFEEAFKSPLNSEPVNKSFKMYLKPFLKSHL